MGPLIPADRQWGLLQRSGASTAPDPRLHIALLLFIPSEVQDSQGLQPQKLLQTPLGFPRKPRYLLQAQMAKLSTMEGSAWQKPARSAQEEPYPGTTSGPGTSYMRSLETKPPQG